MIYIVSKRKSVKTLLREYHDAVIVDVTSSSPTEFVMLSPFYPHGNIPIPNSEGVTASCVEAVWQGLKVFESSDIDTSLFYNDTMRNLKRTIRKYGKPLGHRFGVKSKTLLDYIDARKLIYIPTYNWVLENKAEDLIKKLAAIAAKQNLVLLDYNTNGDVERTDTPLSHASLIKAYIESNYTINKKHIPSNLFDYE
ncbi:MAG: hypothetical protein K2G11_00745 [Muribaculaceae bacterium]|nr:hypothetical protein [Muribaculaceae bacterium]